MDIMQLLLGMALGSILTSIAYRFKKASGVLRIDSSNPEKRLYRFEIADLDTLDKKSIIELRIDHHANLSQK